MPVNEDFDNQDNPTSQDAAGADGEQQQQISEADQRILDIATAAGWKATGPMNAEDFLRTMPERFKAKGNELKELKKSVDAIKNTFHQATAAQYEKGLKDKEAEMQAAKAAYDFDKYEKAKAEHQQLQQMKEQQQEQQTADPEVLPEVDAFVKRNAWFDKDKAMTADALHYKELYLKTNPGAPAKEVLEYVEKRIKRDYPESFEQNQTGENQNEQRRPAAGVETGNRGGNSSVAQWQRDSKLLNQLERDMMKIMCSETRNGKPVMTEQKYIENMRAQGAFDGRK